MALDHAPLQITIVTGADPALRRRMLPVIADEHWAVGHAGRETAEVLATTIRTAARGGLRGSLALSLHPACDPLEMALVLQARFADRHPADHVVQLRDVVTIAHGRELRPLLDHAAVDDIGDIDAPEAAATRIEAATAIVITGDNDPRLRDLAHAMNPRAPVLDERGLDRARYRRVLRAPVDDLGRAQGWMLALRGALISTSAAEVVVFRDPRPFHPFRLAQVVADGLRPQNVGTIWRSRGLVRLASRAERVGSWSTAGPVLALDPTAMTSDDLDAPSGQEIVLMGHELDARAINDALGSALLTSNELLDGPMGWARYADPFPAWERAHGH